MSSADNLNALPVAVLILPLLLPVVVGIDGLQVSVGDIIFILIQHVQRGSVVGVQGDLIIRQLFIFQIKIIFISFQKR